ncbi:hypothetical protein BH10PSE19_BH10PSE19_12450 [soil metagenome]
MHAMGPLIRQMQKIQLCADEMKKLAESRLELGSSVPYSLYVRFKSQCEEMNKLLKKSFLLLESEQQKYIEERIFYSVISFADASLCKTLLSICSGSSQISILISMNLRTHFLSATKKYFDRLYPKLESAEAERLLGIFNEFIDHFFYDKKGYEILSYWFAVMKLQTKGEISNPEFDKATRIVIQTMYDRVCFNLTRMKAKKATAPCETQLTELLIEIHHHLQSTSADSKDEKKPAEPSVAASAGKKKKKKKKAVGKKESAATAVIAIPELKDEKKPVVASAAKKKKAVGKQESVGNAATAASESKEEKKQARGSVTEKEKTFHKFSKAINSSEPSFGSRGEEDERVVSAEPEVHERALVVRRWAVPLNVVSVGEDGKGTLALIQHPRNARFRKPPAKRVSPKVLPAPSSSSVSSSVTQKNSLALVHKPRNLRVAKPPVKRASPKALPAPSSFSASSSAAQGNSLAVSIEDGVYYLGPRGRAQSRSWNLGMRPGKGRAIFFSSGAPREKITNSSNEFPQLPMKSLHLTMLTPVPIAALIVEEQGEQKQTSQQPFAAPVAAELPAASATVVELPDVPVAAAELSVAPAVVVLDATIGEEKELDSLESEFKDVAVKLLKIKTELPSRTQDKIIEPSKLETFKKALTRIIADLLLSKESVKSDIEYTQSRLGGIKVEDTNKLNQVNRLLIEAYHSLALCFLAASAMTIKDLEWVSKHVKKASDYQQEVLNAADIQKCKIDKVDFLGLRISAEARLAERYTTEKDKKASYRLLFNLTSELIKIIEANHFKSDLASFVNEYTPIIRLADWISWIMHHINAAEILAISSDDVDKAKILKDQFCVILRSSSKLLIPQPQPLLPQPDSDSKEQKLASREEARELPVPLICSSPSTDSAASASSREPATVVTVQSWQKRSGDHLVNNTSGLLMLGRPSKQWRGMTVQDGNNAVIHALRGEWDEKSKRFICSAENIRSTRLEMARCIRIAKAGDVGYSYLMAAREVYAKMSGSRKTWKSYSQASQESSCIAYNEPEFQTEYIRHIETLEEALSLLDMKVMATFLQINLAIYDVISTSTKTILGSGNKNARPVFDRRLLERINYDSKSPCVSVGYFNNGYVRIETSGSYTDDNAIVFMLGSERAQMNLAAGSSGDRAAAGCYRY